MSDDQNDSMDKGLFHLDNAIQHFSSIKEGNSTDILSRIVQTIVLIAETIIELRKNKIL